MIETGDKGEKIAKDFLIENDYQILESNYRFKKAEIDIIAKIDNLLVFIEVKTRKNKSFGNPEDFVSDRQKELIMSAADEYLFQNPSDRIRFDIISIIMHASKISIKHFIDAF